MTPASLTPTQPATPASVSSPPDTTPVKEVRTWSKTTPLSVYDLEEFENLHPKVQKLIHDCLKITSQKLEYDYGSADPKEGGMDCSGFVHYVVGKQGFRKVPRQANHFYLWVRLRGRFYSVLSSNPRTAELKELQPGDLLFWTGTYDIKRDPPVTHVMVYLGRLKEDGRGVMAGASEGRRFGGRSTSGVTVYDFELPRAGSEGRFVGYGAIPGLVPVKSPSATSQNVSR